MNFYKKSSLREVILFSAVVLISNGALKAIALRPEDKIGTNDFCVCQYKLEKVRRDYYTIVGPSKFLVENTSTVPCSTLGQKRFAYQKDTLSKMHIVLDNPPKISDFQCTSFVGTTYKDVMQSGLQGGKI